MPQIASGIQFTSEINIPPDTILKQLGLYPCFA